MDDFSERLEQLLSDPQALSRLGELAAGLGLGQAPPHQPAQPPILYDNFLGCQGERRSGNCHFDQF